MNSRIFPWHYYYVKHDVYIQTKYSDRFLLRKSNGRLIQVPIQSTYITSQGSHAILHLLSVIHQWIQKNQYRITIMSTSGR